MKVSVFLLCYNERVLLPHTVSHYRMMFPGAVFTVIDHSSTDGSPEIARSLGCNVYPFRTDCGIDQFRYIHFKNNCWKIVDEGWAVVCDMDEWLCADEESLEREEREGSSILQCKGACIVGDSKSETLDDVDLHSMDMAVGSPPLDKAVCFMPRHIKEMNYDVGAHRFSPVGEVRWGGPYLLKHMDYLGLPFKIKKNRVRFERSEEMRKRNLSTHYVEHDGSVEAAYNRLRKAARSIRHMCECFAPPPPPSPPTPPDTNPRVDALNELISKAADKYKMPEMLKMPLNTQDRGNEDPNARVYSMCYDRRRPELKPMCGPDWTFVRWPDSNIPCYEATRNEVMAAGGAEPKTEKACWFGNMNSPLNDAVEYLTRPRLVRIGGENTDIMEVRHVYPPLPAHHPDYRSMPDLVREYRAMIDIGGNGYSGRIKWLLFSRRPIVMVDRFYVEYFHDDLRPWEHYIPVRMDLSDLVEKVRWTLGHKEEAREMAERALSFAMENFTEDRLLARVKEVWKKMAESTSI